MRFSPQICLMLNKRSWPSARIRIVQRMSCPGIMALRMRGECEEFCWKIYISLNLNATFILNRKLLLSKLVFETEKLAGRSTTSFRKIVNDVAFTVPFEKEGDRIRIDIHADTFITSKKPIQADESNANPTSSELPKLFPLKHTISMPTSNIYTSEDFYRELRFFNFFYSFSKCMIYLAILNGTSFNHPHTILLHFSPLEVKNLHETQVTESQFKSRALLKTFAVAAASARSKHGVSFNFIVDISSLNPNYSNPQSQ